MSYNKLESFLKKLSRVLYQDDVTPIVMDHLLERKIAEDFSLAYILKLEQSTVKQALDRLEQHGILTKRTKKSAEFKNFREKLGPEMLVKDKDEQEFEFNLKPYINVVDFYCFNIDLMFVLKARIFRLRQMFNEKQSHFKHHGHTYHCSNRSCFEFDSFISEIDASSTMLVCQRCKSKLQKQVQQDELDNDQVREGEELIAGLEEDLQKFQNYRIPSPFFGMGVDFSSRINPQNIESVQDVDFIVKLGGRKRKVMMPGEVVPIRQEKQIPLDKQSLLKMRDEMRDIFKYYLEQTVKGAKSNKRMRT